MTRSRNILFRTAIVLILLLGAMAAAILWLLWMGIPSGFPPAFDILRDVGAEQTMIITIGACAGLLVLSLITYLLSMGLRQDRRPLWGIYLVWLAAALPIAGVVGGAMTESSALLAVAAFAGVALGIPLIIFVFEFFAGIVAKTCAVAFNRFDAHRIAGRFFALARVFRPTDPDLLRHYAFAEFMGHNYKRATLIFERLRDQGFNDRELLDALETSYRSQQDWAKDIEILNLLRRDNPREIHYVRLLAQAHEHLQHWPEALQAREATLETRNAGQLEDVARLALRANRIDRALEHTRRLRDLEMKPYRRAFELYAEIIAASPTTIEPIEELADLHVRAENEPKAVALWERALQIDPARTQTRQKLIEYTQRSGQLDQEEQQLRLLLQHDPQNAPACLRLAENLSEQKRADDARQVLKDGIERFPADFRFAFEYSRQCLLEGNLEEAESALVKAESIAGKAEVSRLGVIRRRIETEKVNRELKELQKQVQENPSDPEPRFALIDRLATRSDWAAIRVEFDQLLGISPYLKPQVIEHLNFLIAKTDENFLLLDYMADLLFGERDFDQALAIYERMARQSIHGEQTLIEGCRKILRASPDFRPALSRLGTLQVEAQQWEESIATNTHYLELSDQFDAVKVRELYQAQLALGRLGEAEGYAQSLLAEEPQNASLRLQLMDALEEQQRYEDALRFARELIEVQPSNPSFQRRHDLLLRKRKRQRIDELAGELTTQTDIPEKSFELADLYEEAQEYDAAIVQFQRAAREPKLRNMATARLGHCMALRGIFDEAVLTLSQVTLTIGAGEEEDELKRLLYESAVLLEEENMGTKAIELYKAIFRVDASFRDIVARLSRYRA